MKVGECFSGLHERVDAVLKGCVLFALQAAALDFSVQHFVLKESKSTISYKIAIKVSCSTCIR